ncbi:MAG: hypothetical protein ACR2NP_20245 [Pirellulaceae bacterium]
MEHQQLFHNLVQMAAVDGKFTEEEIRFLVDRAERWGIPNDEFETALAGLDSEIELRMPEKKEDRLEMLREMIRLMAVDGELAEPEKRLCAAASASMEISGSEFAAIVDGLLRE